jgi:hypothetical protein
MKYYITLKFPSFIFFFINFYFSSTTSNTFLSSDWIQLYSLFSLLTPFKLKPYRSILSTYFFPKLCSKDIGFLKLRLQQIGEMFSFSCINADSSSFYNLFLSVCKFIRLGTLLFLLFNEMLLKELFAIYLELSNLLSIRFH